MTSRRRWVWFGGTSHRIHGYGSGIHMWLDEFLTDLIGHPLKSLENFTTVACITYCGLRVEVHVPTDSAMSDAAQPKGRPVCETCEAGIVVPEHR